MVKKPGIIAKMCSNASGNGVYASSADGRFVVWVRRRMVGSEGRRSYNYRFTAVDRERPSDGQKFTDIPLRPNETSSPTKVFEAVGRYVSELKE